MGMSCYSKLVVGVPLKDVGEIVFKEKKVDIKNALGESTSKTAYLRDVYLVTPNKNILFGSNKNNLINGYSRIEYSYYDIVDGDEDWIQISDYEGNINHVVIGKSIQSHSSRDNVIDICWLSYIELAKKEVAKYLKENFWYEGHVFVMSMCVYSY